MQRDGKLSRCIFCCAALQSRDCCADAIGMTDAMDAILSDAAAAHPEPNEQAAQIVTDVMSADSATPIGAPTAGQLDRKQAPYDPAKHDGTLTARGTWRKRRNSSAPGNVEPSAQASIDQAPMGVVEPITIDTRAVAESWLDGAFVTLPMLLGEDWEPTADERRKLIDALERYMIAAGIEADLPPGWALLLAVGVFALPRIATQNTKNSRLGVMLGKLRKRKEPIEKEDKQKTFASIAA